MLLFEAFLCVFDNTYLPFLYIGKKFIKNIFINFYVFENCMKSPEFVLNIIFFVFKTFSKNFREYIRIENPSYKIA